MKLLKGVLLDRIFNLLRDGDITEIPYHTFSEILSSIRPQNLGWRFFVDSINKLEGAGETDDLFFEKSFNLIKGQLRLMTIIDMDLIKIFVDQLLIPYFENTSTLVRKLVVLNLAELKFVMDVRL